jgi:uncharacterized coiled-coil protein SlyX
LATLRRMSDPEGERGEQDERLDQHERRLTELEIEAAFRRQTSDDLDEVIREQGRRIDALERRIAELLELSSRTGPGERSEEGPDDPE